MHILSFCNDTRNASKHPRIEMTDIKQEASWYDSSFDLEHVPERDGSGYWVIAMDDRIDSAQKLIHIGDLCDVLLT